MNRNDMIYYSWITSAASGCKFSKEKIKKSSIIVTISYGKIIEINDSHATRGGDIPQGNVWTQVIVADVVPAARPTSASPPSKSCRASASCSA